MTILQTSNLTKKYRRITALNQLNFSIEEGMIFGLLGPNGSGKTTTLGLILSVLKPTSGEFQWFEQSPSAESRRKIGAILETPCFYPYMTAVQNLQVVATIKKCPLSAIDRVLEVVGLYERRNDPFKTYSLGMKQRLAIGAALLVNPPVLILDEPTNGLDPQGIVEIRELVQQIAQTGKTIILASHLLDEVQKVCTDFMVLRKGKKLFQGNVKQALSDQRIIEVGADDLPVLIDTLTNFNGVTKIERQKAYLQLHTKPEIDARMISQVLFDKGIIVNRLIERQGSLERQFLKILAEN